MLFTTWPMIWASGGTVINEQGTASTIDNPQAVGVYQLYRKIVRDGLAPTAVKNENGPTWTQAFSNGQIGIQPAGATILQRYYVRGFTAGPSRADSAAVPATKRAR
jgi:multiple sugar transport system substrate-binding protein